MPGQLKNLGREKKRRESFKREHKYMKINKKRLFDRDIDFKGFELIIS